MNHSTIVDVPSAHITRKKSRLKVYGQTLFLNDGDNFEIELYNPKPKPVLAKIKINGEYISLSGIIVNPGQRVFLERFLDSNNKFQFSTYEVENTPQNKSAIASNGDVTIEFYDKQDFIYNINPYITGTNSVNWESTSYPNIRGIVSTSNSLGTFAINSTVNYTNTSSIDTGRVEKGDSSNQTFEYHNDHFSSAVSKRYDFKILPYSQKNITSSELKQYCTECGTKVKSNYKFCPSCGNKI
jgi:hypothetical protein